MPHHGNSVPRLVASGRATRETDRVTAPVSYVEPSARERKAILDRTRSIAVVGASSNPSRASNFVMTYLASSVCDFDLYPVNPRETEINGIPCHPSLEDLPVVPDLVDVFRRPEDCPEIARAAVAIGAEALWLQLGIVSDEAAEIRSPAGSTSSWTVAPRSSTHGSPVVCISPASTPV